MKVRSRTDNIVKDVIDSNDLKGGILSGEYTPLETNRNYYVRDGEDLWKLPNHEKWREAISDNPELVPLLDMDIEKERKEESSGFFEKVATFQRGIISGIPFGKAALNKGIDLLADAGFNLHEHWGGEGGSNLDKEQKKTKAKEMGEVYSEANPIASGAGHVAGAVGSALVAPAPSKAIPIVTKLLPSSAAIPAYVAAKSAPKVAKVAAEGAAWATAYKASDIAEEVTRTDTVLPIIASHLTASTLADIGIGAAANVGLYGIGKGVGKAVSELIPGAGPTGKDTIGNKVAAWGAGKISLKNDVEKELYKNALKRQVPEVAEALPPRGESRNFIEWRTSLKNELFHEGIWNPNNPERRYLIEDAAAKIKFRTKMAEEGSSKTVKEAFKTVKEDGVYGTATDKELKEVNKLFDKVFNDDLLRSYEKNDLITKQKLDTFYGYFKAQESIDDQINILRQIIDEGGIKSLKEEAFNIGGLKVGATGLARAALGASTIFGVVNPISSGLAYIGSTPIRNPNGYLKFLQSADKMIQHDMYQSLTAAASSPTKILTNKGIYELVREWQKEDKYTQFQNSLEERIQNVDSLREVPEMEKFDEASRETIFQRRIDALNYLSENAPKNKILANGKVVPPSSKDLVDYAKRVRAATDPIFLFSKLRANAKLDTVEREVLETFHSNIYELWLTARGAQAEPGNVIKNEKVNYDLTGKNKVTSPVFQLTWEIESEQGSSGSSSSKNTPVSKDYKTNSQKIIER